MGPTIARRVAAWAQSGQAGAVDGTRDAEVDVDVVLVGGGGAGSALLIALDARMRSSAAAGRPRPIPRVAVIDPVRKQGNDRTWCFWDAGHAGGVEPAVSRSWDRLEIVGPTGARQRIDIRPARYALVRSAELYALAEAAADRLGVRRIQAAADGVHDGGRAATVVAGGERLRCRWVFDSRPRPPDRPGSTLLLQHFRGWVVRGPDGTFEAETPTLMDFSVPQPAHGVGFGYCLPLESGRALVEYTEFSRHRLDPPAYDAALRDYLRRRWPAAVPVPGEVEDGVIPMTDGVFARRDGARVFRLGTAGGATRPSTGYTFAAMQRQAGAVAAALLERREPLPPVPYPARHRWMDAVLLRALDRGLVSGPELFTGLFASNPPGRVLRFLDGASSPAEEIALMAGTPLAAMARAAASLGRAQSRLSTRADASPV